MPSIALLLAAAAAIAPPAANDEIIFRAYGTVVAVPNTPSAPFTGAAVGDPVEFRTTVPKDGMPADPYGVIYTYPARPGSLLTIGSAFSAEDPDPINLSAIYVYDDYPGAGDLLETGMSLPNPAVGLQLELWDPTGAVFATPILDDLRGVYTPADFGGGARFELIEGCAGCATVRIALTRIEIGLPEPPIGTSYCGPAATNSTGASAAISATGSVDVVQNQVALEVVGLPPSSFGFFLTSRQPGLVTQPGGSQGDLCLGGSIGRFGDSVQSSGAAGEFSFDVDLTAVAQPTGTVAVLAGETWHFQAWYRDANPGLTSNFSDGLALTFQ